MLSLKTENICLIREQLKPFRLQLFTQFNQNIEILNSKINFIECFNHVVYIIWQCLNLTHSQFPLRLWFFLFLSTFHHLFLFLNLLLFFIFSFCLFKFFDPFGLFFCFSKSIFFGSKISILQHLFVFRLSRCILVMSSVSFFSNI